MSPIRVGVVGYGRMGRLRASYLQQMPEFELSGVCEIELAGDEMLSCPVYEDYRELVEADVDAVFTCTPNFLNAEVTHAALESGKHVFCEKPPARNVSEMKTVVECETRHPHLKLKFGFNHRYHDAVQEAKALVDSGRLGKILWLRGVYGKSGGPGFEASWRNQRELSGGGILLDQGIHMLDLFRLFAGEFHEVKSFITSAFWEVDVEDNAFAMMKNDAGKVAVLHSSATHWKHNFTLDVYLSDGYVQINGILAQSRSYGRESLVTASRGFTQSHSQFAFGNPREEVTFYDHDASWQRELEEFAAAIIENRPIEVGTSDDALKALDLVERIYQADSSWSRESNVATRQGEKAEA